MASHETVCIRSKNGDPRYPDFSQKENGNLFGTLTNGKPPGLETELAAIVPGSLQENISSWNRKLSRYFRSGEYEKTIQLFQQLQREGLNPDSFTYVPVVNACSSLHALELGRHVHLQIIQTGHESDIYVGSCLVDMYAKCGSIEDALGVFNKMPLRDVVCWSAIVLGHVKCGQGKKALELFQQMQQEGVEPNSLTFVAVLNACARVGALDEGKRVHQQIIKKGFDASDFVGSSLIDMYAKCGSIKDAWKVFVKMHTSNLVAWTAMILGLVKYGQGKRALRLFQQMQEEGIDADAMTFVGVLNACASAAALDKGQWIHELIRQKGFESNVFVGSSIMDMYIKCGSIEEAQIVFDKMHERDVVSWTTMILGYLKCGEAQKALELSQEMESQGVEHNLITFVGMVNACASTAALAEGRNIHKKIIQRGYESNVFVSSSLINMYAKCGSIEDARSVFEKMPIHDVVSWNAMLGGYAMHGLGKEALEIFGHMRQQGAEVNMVTFVYLLSACSHAGLVEEGLHIFDSMSTVYNINPTVDHYACIVDLLGRAGWLNEAEDLIKTMSAEPNACMWMSLLSSCRVHGNLEMGEVASKEVLRLDPENGAGYVLLSNTYVTTGKSEHSRKVQQPLVERIVKKA